MGDETGYTQDQKTLESNLYKSQRILIKLDGGV